MKFNLIWLIAGVLFIYSALVSFFTGQQLVAIGLLLLGGVFIYAASKG